MTKQQATKELGAQTHRVAYLEQLLEEAFADREKLSDGVESYSRRAAYAESCFKKAEWQNGALREQVNQLNAQNQQLAKDNLQMKNNLDVFRNRFVSRQMDMKSEALFWNIDIQSLIKS
jgi:chromosome segregation ATPase